MKTSNLSLSQDNSTLILQKLLDLKKTLSQNTAASNEDRDVSISSCKSERKSSSDLPTDTDLDNSINSSQKLDLIRNQIIGLRTVVKSPFGFSLEGVYADHTATNRPYESV